MRNYMRYFKNKKVSKSIQKQELNSFVFTKHLPPTQKQDGSGWKLSKIPILEIFGPTIQGEGMVIGQKTMFVRTAGCDYSCSWCDSAFTWDGSAKDDIHQMTAEEIWAELKRIGGDNFSFVTISGGNPALLKNLDVF